MSTENILWMGDVQPWMDESFIMSAFNFYEFYPQSIKLIHDKITRELKNYCFINFKTIEEANKCLIVLTGKAIPNTQIKFKLNWANYFSAFNKSVYVGNLNPDVDDISLYKLFKEKYPSVLHASVIVDKGVSKGFGFILFRGEEDYEKCLKEMNGVLFHGNIIKVNEQKKSNKNNNSNNNKSNSNEIEYDDLSNSNDYNNADVVYNYEENNNNYNILNNMDYFLQNNIKNNNNLNTNSIIGFYKANNGFNNNNISSQNNLNSFNLLNGKINPQIQSDYTKQFQLNNMNNPNIIHNVININNINKIQNINYINDINQIYNNNQIINKNNKQNNKNYMQSINNINISNETNNNHLELSNKQQMIYLNNNRPNQQIKDVKLINNKDINITNEIIKEEKPLLLSPNNIVNKTVKNDIMSQINEILINKRRNKKGKKEKYNLEILKNYDNEALNKIISKKLDMMYKYYIEKYPYELNKLIISNMFLYYCQNEKQLNFYKNIF